MRVADVIGTIATPSEDVRIEAYDTSTLGRTDAPVRITIRSPRALTYIARSPSSLGLGRAYVAGDLDVDGDMYTALRALSGATRINPVRRSERIAALRTLGPHALRPAPKPEQEIRLRGQRHSKRRDQAAIAHHYDVSNTFYEWVLGPSMAYTCAVFPREDASLEEAQANKFDLVCRKLGLQPGMRLLDVGCGWGGMVMHAAEHYGVQAIGVTLSRKQAEWAQKAIADAGLTDRAEVRHSDYRDVSERDFDAISSIGLTEHIGKAQLPAYFSFLASRAKPGARLLNHCIMRPTTEASAIMRRGFINRYVFPDGELEALGTVVSAMQDNGFEVRHEENLREHYALTLKHWGANLDAHWDEALREVGPGTARVWRLYMAGSRLGFDRHDIELHQVLGVKLDGEKSHFPLRPDFGV